MHALTKEEMSNIFDRPLACRTCGGTMQPGMTIHTIHRRTYHLIIHETPALVCDQCGEEWLDGEVVAMFDDAIGALDKLNEQLAAFAPRLPAIAKELAGEGAQEAEPAEIVAS